MLSVSTKEHLELCRRYSMAGTTNSPSGVWAYVDIKPGDYVSLLYGAKVYDLYAVEKKYAIKNAESIGPWPKVTFKESGRSYYFPFRFELEPNRRFEELLVREGYEYVAENLLLRGGYRKTHFQTDQATLQHVSQLGEISSPGEEFNYEADTFEPVFMKYKSESHPPESYPFSELILQSLLKDYLSNEETLNYIVETFTELRGKRLEVLGEKALQKGHVDILIKEAVPIEKSNKIVIEVKNRPAKLDDLDQLVEYKQELGKKCLGAILIASKFSGRVLDRAKELGIEIATFGLDWSYTRGMTYDELQGLLKVSFTHK